MLIRREDMLGQILENLTILQNRIKISNALGRTDMDSAAEDFYCGLLNIVLGGYRLKNLNLLQMDFPAIDLADEERRLCVQVTSTNGRKKVESTLQKFFENNLHQRFDRLIVLIIGEKKNYRKAFKVESGFDFDRNRDIWDTNRLVQEINKLDDESFGSVHVYLRNALSIPDTSVSLQLPLHTSLGVDGFVGRQEELRALEKAIADHDKPIILSGLGGMGKTELATHFGRNYGDGKVYLASFQKSFRETVTQSIAKGIPDLLDKKLPEDEVYKTVMNRLGQCVKDDILILDNVDRDTGSFADLLDEAYDALCGLDMRLIFTTRFDVDRAFEIKQLSNSELYQIFRKHKVTISDQEMDALIQAVDGHTLTIDLMARTMKGGWRKVTADMLLQALQEKNLAEQNYRAVSTDYNRSAKQERIYDHLRTVFNVAGVPDAAKSVLCYATLLPQDGMDAETFGMALQGEEQQTLDDLIDHGWLAVKDDILTIHPVVRLVCREELKPSDENCASFLEAIWKQKNTPLQPLQGYCQLAELYATASKELKDRQGTWALRSGWHYHELGDYLRALEYENKAATILETNDFANAKDLATVYNNVGNTYGRLGETEKAFEYQQKAFTLLSKELPENHPDMAVIYSNIGVSCGDLGDNEFALHCLLKAIDIHENNPTIDVIALAQAYSYAGLCYADSSNYTDAIRYLNKAMNLLDRNESTHYRVLLTLHNNFGGIYCLLGDRRNALSHQLKSLELMEKLALNEHPDAAVIYHNIAMSYAHLGNLLQALDYEKRSLSIAAQFYPSNHQHVTTPKANIAYIEKILNLPKKQQN